MKKLDVSDSSPASYLSYVLKLAQLGTIPQD